MIPFIYKSRKFNLSIVTESRSLVAWGLEVGCVGVGCIDYQGAQGNFGGNGYAHYIDCDDGFTVSKHMSKLCHFES